MATESGVILPADSTGKALRTESLTTAFTTGAGGVVQQQVVSLGDPTTAGNLAGVNANGALLVANPDSPTTGNLAVLNDQVSVATGGRGEVAFQLTGTWVGTVTFQGTVSPTGVSLSSTWLPINATVPAGAPSTTTTTNGIYVVRVGAYTAVRVTFTAYTSGIAQVWTNASDATNTVTLAEGIPPGTSTIGTFNQQSTTLAAAATGAISTAVTATLPAAGAGLSHYITNIEIQRYAGAALTGAAAPVVVTSTNLPGSLAWSFDTAGAIGTSQIQLLSFAGNPLKSLAANTATTIVAPLTTSVIWRINVTYYVA